MTKEEAINWIRFDINMAKFDPSTGEEAYLNEDAKKVIEAQEMAIKALKVEPCEDADRIYALMKDYYFEHKDKHDASWQGGFGKCMNLIPNAYQKQPEPCEDCVNRGAAIKEIKDYIINPDQAISEHPDDCFKYNSGILTAIQVINDLPPAQAKPRTGKWIWLGSTHKCSNCNGYTCFADSKPPKYCPNCGAKMKEGK